MHQLYGTTAGMWTASLLHPFCSSQACEPIKHWDDWTASHTATRSGRLGHLTALPYSLRPDKGSLGSPI